MQTFNTTLKSAKKSWAKRPVRAAAFLAAALMITPINGLAALPFGIPEVVELPSGDALPEAPAATPAPAVAEVATDPVAPATTEEPKDDKAEAEAPKSVDAEAPKAVEPEAVKPVEPEAAKTEEAKPAEADAAKPDFADVSKVFDSEPSKPAQAEAAKPAEAGPPSVQIEVSPPVVEVPTAPAVKIDDSLTAPVTPIGLVEPVKPLAGPTTAPSVAVAEAPVVPVIAPAPATRPAEAVGILDGVPADGKITLLVGRATVLKTRVPYSRVAFSQPDIARDNELPEGLLVTGVKAGATQLIVWDKNEKSQVLEIVVEADLNALTDLVKKNFPGTDVQLSSANGTVVVRGRVPSLQTADQITQLISAYGKVLNFLEMSGGQQVMLQVRFAEVSRSATTALGVNFGFADGRAAQFGNNVPGGGPYSIVDGVGSLTRSVGANVTLFGGGRIGSSEFDIFLSALRNNNLLRVLAEPNLSTVSGKEAQFLAGGEFPIPVPQAGGSGNAAITVEYKQFGVRLSFTPIVLGDGKIRLQGTAEVSDLDFSRSIALSGFQIPSLTKRTVTTTIELNEGQTFAVAGLLNNRVTASKQAVPLLGDIPVLGALFRSVRYERNETELVILVTPRLVEGMNPKQVPEMPGERWAYPTEADLFLNQYLGGPGRESMNKPGPVMFRGPYGFAPAAAPMQQRGNGTVTSVQSER